MPSITTWTRLEPSTRIDDPAPGLEARVEDPLWLLGRQRQLGELTAQDGGSPAFATVRVARAPIDRYLPRALDRDEVADGEPYTADRPLDRTLARDAAPPDLRLRARAGQRLLDHLARAGHVELRARYLAAAPLTAPPTSPDDADPDETAGLLALAAGRIADGLALVPLVDADLAGALDPALRTLLAGWRAWAGAQLATGTAAWHGDRLDHRCTIAAGPDALVATDIEATALDWYAFDAQPGASLGPTAPATERTITAVPAPVRYAGMPATRFWELEDARVYFGGVDVEPADVGRMLLVEFALVGADDWFTIPVALDVGAVHRVVSLEVTDVFGTVTSIDPVDAGRAGGPRWSMFTTSDRGGDPRPLLVVPPTATGALTGDPIERVDVVRDEGANLAWGIEQRAADRLGRPIELHARAAAARAPAPPPSSVPRYRLRTELPPTWIPYVARPLAPGVVQLERGRLLGAEGLPPARTRLLADSPVLREEEVPRDGLALHEAWRYARWLDGSIHAWRVREVTTRTTAPASRLAHDVLATGDD